MYIRTRAAGEARDWQIAASPLHRVPDEIAALIDAGQEAGTFPCGPASGEAANQTAGFWATVFNVIDPELERLRCEYTLSIRMRRGVAPEIERSLFDELAALQMELGEASVIERGLATLLMSLSWRHGRR